MMDVLLVLLVLVGVVSAFVPMIVARQRRAAVERAAAEPVLIDGRSYDAAEVLWTFRQVNESPHLSALTAAEVTTSAGIVSTINRTVAALPPAHAADVVAAQRRLRRTRQFRGELLEAPRVDQSLIPALGDAAVIALAGQDPSPVGHLLDIHVPIVSIVMAIVAARRSTEAGLDPDRIAENLMWDVGAKGGAIVAGAGIGSMVMPGIGTVIGGLAGAIGGSFAATYGKQRHLRSAIADFRASCETLGRDVSEAHLEQIAQESNATIEMKISRLSELEAELATIEAGRSWFQRTFQPAVGLALAGRAIELGRADTQVDRFQHEGLTGLLSSTTHSAEFRGYAWVASLAHLDWLDHNGPEANEGLEALDKVRIETTNLSLAAR